MVKPLEIKAPNRPYKADFQFSYTTLQLYTYKSGLSIYMELIRITTFILAISLEDEINSTQSVKYDCFHCAEAFALLRTILPF